MSQVQDNLINMKKRVAPPAAKHPVSLWRNRDFMLLWSGQFISSIGTQVSKLAFPLLILAVTYSPAQAGLIAAIGGLPFALLCLPAGALVDRWDRKRVMLLCDTGRAIAFGSIPIALAIGHLILVQLYLVALIEGTLFTFFSLAEMACLPQVVAKEQIPAATAQNQFIDSFSWLFGPALGGVLYSLGRAIPFVADAISYACSVLSLFFIKTQFQQERVTAPSKLRADIAEGVTWLWRHSLLRFIAILTCGLLTPCVGFSLIIIVLAQSQHASAFVIGLIFASGGVGSIVGTIIIAPLQRHFRFSQLMLFTTWLWALSWLALVIAPNPLVLGIVNGISFIVVPMYLVVQFSYRLAAIPDHLQGRVNSVFRLISFGTQPIGLAITGLLLQVIGPIPTIVVLFIPQGILAVAATFNKHLRNAPPIGGATV